MSTIRDINRYAILKVLGVLLIIEGIFMLASLIPSMYYDKEFISGLRLFDPTHDFLPLFLSGLFTSGLGLVLYFSTRKLDSNSIGRREGYIIVTSAWILISMLGSIPYMLTGIAPTVADAFFETMSGFTTTGASVFTDIESFPKGLLFWRALTHWIGGMGIILLSLAILPILGIGGMQLFIAEVPGVTPDKLAPRITQTAKNLWIVYVVLTLLCTIFLMLGGLDLYDSMCHAFSAVSTGGFGTKNNSVASFTPYLQYVLIVFMFLAGINFSLHYFAFKRRFRLVFTNEELKNYTYIILTAAIIISIGIFLSQNISAEYAFRESLFAVVSIITSTGFISSDYLQWPYHAWIIILLLMFVGGCAGSTGGGIKVIRIVLLVRNGKMEMKRLIHPQAIIPVRLNGKPVPQNIIFNVLAFFLLYIVVFAAGALVVSLLGMDFNSSIGGAATCLGNIGPGFGSVGPAFNYGSAPQAAKWVFSFLMLLGRLELFTVLILFTKAFWNR
jgi:trk system potassium uptake protein TrkH